ncbi:DUF6758 family protein [Nocardioides rotundus]|uniref:DUF6758 family protein n=1 Tax=Nocardioides rotundus TaxID=1774216 RepID=UPI001CBE5B75|nr:DUF6758 family protein [Nocardioides rotundus]
MTLTPGCPRCTQAIRAAGERWQCPTHGDVTPLWRPTPVSYDEFAALVVAAAHHPTYLPWPLSPGWRVSDAGVVVDRLDGSGTVLATVTACAGVSELDGSVDVLVVAEEPGTGLGGRVAGLLRDDPGPEVGEGSPSVRVRLGSQAVPLWSVSTSQVGEDLDRSVFAGEAHGRWLWLVLRPASAALLLRDDWILRDVSGMGPPLVELPFAGPTPSW